jgi:hypothetical protein
MQNAWKPRRADERVRTADPFIRVRPKPERCCIATRSSCPRFDRPGHWAMGRGEQHKTRNAGKIKIVGVIDYHTRLAHCETHPAENAKAVSITLRRGSLVL